LASTYSTIIIGIIILAAGLILYYNSNFLMYEIVDYTTKPAIPQDLDKVDYDFILAWADILFLVFLPYLVIFVGIIVIAILLLCIFYPCIQHKMHVPNTLKSNYDNLSFPRLLIQD